MQIQENASYLRALFDDLNKWKTRYPDAEPEDDVKFLFQGILGMGHLLSDEAGVRERIENEIASMGTGTDEPLVTPAGTAYMRLNLRPAAAMGLTAGLIAKMMMNSEKTDYSREDVVDACQLYADMSGTAPLPIEVLQGNGMPSHSASFRRKYRPAYRIISRAYEPLLEAVARIQSMTISTPEPWLVTLDGPCASGKTTDAARLAALFDARVVHTDEYVVPHAHKTPERLSIPGGNCEWERLTSEVLIPWKKGEKCLLRPYECREDAFLEGTEITPSGLMILEGSYCNLPAIRELANVRLFKDIPVQVRMERLKRRESPEYLVQFETRWIPLENAYFEAYGLPDDGCLCIRA